MAKRKKHLWHFDKLLELTSKLTQLNTLMIGSYISLYEIINPSQKSSKSKSSSSDNLVALLKKYDYDAKTRNDMATFLKAQFSDDFPLMYRLWTMMLWSILESFVKDFLAEWIKQDSSIIKKLPISPSEYEHYQGRERYEFIIELTEAKLKHKLGIGISRFETLLEPFGLSGYVREDLAMKILELQQVRHVLIHRNGIADKKLIKRCPWVKSRPGDYVFIDSNVYDMYYMAVADYATQIVSRASFAINK